jgi:hypothetical protein
MEISAYVPYNIIGQVVDTSERTVSYQQGVQNQIIGQCITNVGFFSAVSSMVMEAIVQKTGTNGPLGFLLKVNGNSLLPAVSLPMAATDDYAYIRAVLLHNSNLISFHFETYNDDPAGYTGKTGMNTHNHPVDITGVNDIILYSDGIDDGDSLKLLFFKVSRG